MAEDHEYLDHTDYGSTRWVLLIGLALAAILEVLDVSIINPVLPNLAGSLGCTTEEIGWVSTAYILANVVFLPMTAWFSRRLGLGRYLTISIAVFVGASTLCGFSHSLGEMIVWRILQGAAGAPLISMTQAGILEIFPKREQNMAQGAWALCIMVAPSVAPYIGGWITDNFAWPWIFFINVPLGILAGFIVLTRYKERSHRDRSSADWLGMGLLVLGLGAIQYVLEEGNNKDWLNSALIVRLSILGVLATGFFVAWQFSPRNRQPIINLRVLRHVGLLGAFILSFIIGVGLYSGLFIFPIFAQLVLGFTATKSGIFLLGPGIVMALVVVVASASIEKGVPARDVALTGVLITMVSMWVLGHSNPMSNESDLQLGLYIRNAGLAMSMLPIMTAGVVGLHGSEIGDGAALLGLARQLGGSIGIAIAATKLTQMTSFHRYHLMDRAALGVPAFEDRFQLYTGAFYSRGMSMDAAQHAAAKAIDLQVSLQAYTLAVNNVYILTGVLLAFGLPFLFMMKRAKSHGISGAH